MEFTSSKRLSIQRRKKQNLVGLGGFEPPTSPLSGVRSNQLSYRPKIVCLFFILLRYFFRSVVM